MPGSSDVPQSDPDPAAATSTGLVRRRPGLVWLLALLVVPVLLTAVLLAVRTDPIEDDLQQRSLAALEARGITGAQVDFSGRDATVTVPAGADAEEARRVVAAVDGVRAARAAGGRQDAAQPPVTATSTDAPTPTASEVSPSGAASPSDTTGPQATPTDSASPTAAATPSATVPVVPAVARFSLARTENALEVQAVVRDQATKDAIIAEARSLLDESTSLEGTITIDPATALPNPRALSGLLRALSTASSDTVVRYDGVTITLTGEVTDQATKATAARSAAAAVPGAVLANQLRVPVIQLPPVTEACRTFEDRLLQLMTRNRIGFLSGTSLMTQQSRVSVLRAAVLLKSCDTARVEVGGHTDNLGDPAASLPLSQRRADAVRAELVRLGVPAERIIARGYGESRPLASNATAAGRIANRRVEIKVP